MTLSPVQLIARLALVGTAVAVVICCVHIKHLHGARLGRRETLLLATVLAGVTVGGLLNEDLALTAVVELAVLAGVVAPTVRYAKT